jgi:hypothetical protein
LLTILLTLIQWPCKYFTDSEVVNIMAIDIKIASQFEQGDRPEADALSSLTDDESHNLPATQPRPRRKFTTLQLCSVDCE